MPFTIRPALGIPLLLALAAGTLPARAADIDVGVGITIRQPGVYGRIEIGSAPRPPVLYPQSVVIVPGPVTVVRQPIYLYVPPGHAKDWGKHCGRYNACGQPVYFVREEWVRSHWDEAHHHDGDRDRHGDHDHDDGHPDKDRGKDHDKGRGKGRDK